MSEIENLESYREWDIPAYNLDLFVVKVDQANRKLRSAGLSARFDVAYEEYYVEMPKDDPAEPDVFEERIRASLVGPLVIRNEDFIFAASLETVEAGVLVHSVPGVELGGYEPRGDNNCDHCNLNRDRSRLYLVRDERDGSVKQVGHSCIEAYCGISPKGLWVLEIEEELERISGLGGGRREPDAVDIRGVIAMAWSVSDQGRNYLSVEAARERGEDASGAIVRGYLLNPPKYNPKFPEAYQRYAHARDESAKLLADSPETVDEILAAADQLNADNDYGRNIQIILAAESGLASVKSIGLVASLVAIWSRDKVKRAERAIGHQVAESGYLGQIGARVRDIEIRLSVVRFFENEYGWSTLLIGRTQTNHAVKWFRSGKHDDLESGDTLKLESVSIKAHEEFNGDDVSVLTRGKVDNWAERVAAAQERLRTNPFADLSDLFKSKKDQTRFARGVAGR